MSIDDERRAQYGRKALAAIVADIGERRGPASGALLAGAVNAFALVAGGILARGETWAALVEAARVRGVAAGEVGGILRRAERKGRANPRHWSPGQSLPGRGIPPATSPVPQVADIGADVPGEVLGLLSAVWRAVERQDPETWPAAVLAWCRGRGVEPDEAAAFGCRVLGVEAVKSAIRAAGGEVARLAGFVGETSRGRPIGWFPFREGMMGLCVPVWHPDHWGHPVGWQWRDVTPGARWKSAAMPGGAKWRRWPFGLWMPADSALGPATGPLRPVVIVEGEADALAMAGPAFAAGFDVIGTPGTDWRADWGRLLSGRPCVIVAVDRDEAGQGLAKAIATAAKGLGVPVAGIGSPNGKDWGDAIAAGWRRSELVGQWAQVAAEVTR